MSVTKRGGVVVKQGGALRFLPASVVMRITACPPISRLPGTPKQLLGITHTGGEIVPVVGADGESRRTPLLVCLYLGEPVGLLGCDIVSTGSFDVDPSTEGGVMFDGALARTLDLTAMFASLQTNVRWEG
jgi:hypothetical protein